MFRTLPVFGADARTTADIVNGLMNGKSNNTGLVTLNTGNATTTTINNERISRDSLIILVPVSDAAEADAAPYGSFSNNTDQLSPSVGSTAVVALDTTEEASGVYLSDTSRMNVRNYGIYNVQFSLQLVNNNNAAQYADVWFRVNGTDVARSASRFDIPARKSEGDPSHVVGTVNVFLELQAGDYVEIAATTSSTDVSLENYEADVSIPRPSIPAAIVTLQYIAPSASTNVYVSAQSNGVATVTHFANDTANKTYGYVIVG
tara:strand:- start:1216 stop:1998 length:783 start_codon:yes stop_codon:yes gene_type:complete